VLASVFPAFRDQNRENEKEGSWACAPRRD